MPASQREQEEVARRRSRVIRLRVAGMGFEAIAEEIESERQRRIAAGDLAAAARVRYTAKHAVMDVRRGLGDAQERLAELGDLHLALELERLDTQYRAVEAILAQARTAGDRWQALRAIDRQTQISGMRNKLLGLARTTEAVASEGRPGVASAVDQLARKRAARASGR